MFSWRNYKKYQYFLVEKKYLLWGTHNICFHGEIIKISVLFVVKKNTLSGVGSLVTGFQQVYLLKISEFFTLLWSSSIIKNQWRKAKTFSVFPKFQSVTNYRDQSHVWP